VSIGEERLRKKVLTIGLGVLFTIVAIGLLSRPASADSSPTEGSPGSGDTIVYDHSSVLTVVETITYSGGVYTYSYSFTNVETDYIWLFFVYERSLEPVSSLTSFAERTNWNPYYGSIGTRAFIYDARNLDPAITGLVEDDPPDWTFSGTTAYPISVGMSVSGFSFKSSSYDPNPQYYGYELHGNYGVVSGKVSAVGLTCIVSRVIPEVPLGTVMAGAAMLFACLAFIGIKPLKMLRRRL
jgi:hypothetical protein